MKKSLKPAAIATIALLALLSIKLHSTKAMNPSAQIWSPGCVSYVPKVWGQFKGGSAQSGLAFEDNTGTLRFVTNVPCGATPTVALEVRRSAANSSNDGGQ
jgi:hypothetical protein